MCSIHDIRTLEESNLVLRFRFVLIPG
jgi:hypothetical protein